MPRPRAALNRGGVEPVDVELIADLFEQAQFGFVECAIGGGHVAGQRIGRFMQAFGQRFADQAKEGIQPVFLFKQVKDRLADRRDAVVVVAREHWQQVQRGFDFDQFGGANVFVRGRDRDHQRDKAILGAEREGRCVGHREIL